MRLPGSLTVVIVAAVLVAACTPSSAPPATDRSDDAIVDVDVDARRRELLRLQVALADVADAQARVPAYAEELRGFADVDAGIFALRDPATITTARETWPTAAQAIPDVTVTDAEQESRAAVEVGRRAVIRARMELDDPWEASYVEAQDAVLIAVRDYASASIALRDELLAQRVLYADLVDAVTAFVEERWFYRDDDEAAGAFEVALSTHRAAWESARARRTDLVRERAEAAAALNAASDEAAAIWAAIPSDQPTPEPVP